MSRWPIDGGPTKAASTYLLDRFSGFSQEVWSKLVDIDKALEVVAAQPKHSHARRVAVRLAAQTLGCHAATIYRRLDRKSDEVLTLAPRRPGPPKGRSNLAPYVDVLIDDLLRAEYMTKQRKPLSAVVDAIKEACDLKDWPHPSYKAVRARLQKMDLREVALKRGELLKAESLTLRPGAYDVPNPMAVWQIDHTIIDLLVVSALDGKVIGRPTLTLIVDVASRMIAGFYLSFARPSAISVAMALLRAVSPKEPYLESLNIQGEWPIQGPPLALHSDNACEFIRSLAYRRGCQNHHIDPIARPPSQPRFGGHIERLIGTMMGRVHLLPGTTFSNPRQREKYDSSRMARMTLYEVERWLVEEILAYNDRRHSVLGCSPNQAWSSLTRENSITHSPPEDLEAFRRDFLPLGRATIQRHGFEFKTLEYASPAIAELKRAGQKHVEFRYDPFDLSSVYIVDHRGTYVDVPNRYPSCPAITLYEVQAILQKRRLAKEGPSTGSITIAAIQEQRIAWRSAEGLSKQELRARELATERHGGRLPPISIPSDHRSQWEELLRDVGAK